MINVIPVSSTSPATINGAPIYEEIFEEEKIEYCLIEKDVKVDDLISWIPECGPDRENDAQLMKQDLTYLMRLDDTVIFSSISTNNYVAQSDDPDGFRGICKDLLVMSGFSEDGAEDALSGECM
jgi:hypothetical protein